MQQKHSKNTAVWYVSHNNRIERNILYAEDPALPMGFAPVRLDLIGRNG